MSPIRNMSWTTSETLTIFGVLIRGSDGWSDPNLGQGSVCKPCDGCEPDKSRDFSTAPAAPLEMTICFPLDWKRVVRTAKPSKSSASATLRFLLARRNLFGVQKNFKKVQKKACQPLTRSIKRKADATSAFRRPFKKTLEKVKKKLVSVRKS